MRVHFTGRTVEDGKVFDTSLEGDPLKFALGDRAVIRGFEEAVEGMAIGESKTVRVPAIKAYGPHRDDLVFVVGRRAIPPNIEPKKGQPLEYRQPDGRALPITVIAVSEQTVTPDGNHLLAGKELAFDLELVGIAD